MSASVSEAGAPKENDRVELGMRVLVTVAVLGAALFIILSNRNASDQHKWAFGAIGTVLGYWLKVQASASMTFLVRDGAMAGRSGKT